jgi:hypothetical protein
MFIVMEARIEARLMILDIRASNFKPLCFDISVVTHKLLTIYQTGVVALT